MTTTAIHEQAMAHFAGKLEFETDPSDVRAAQLRGDDFVLLDTRSTAAWRQGRAAGAVHLPTAEIPRRAADVLDRTPPAVVYGWGRDATARPRPPARSPNSASPSRK